MINIKKKKTLNRIIKIAITLITVSFVVAGISIIVLNGREKFNFKKAQNIEELLKIDSVYYVDVMDKPYVSDVNTVKNCLFDGNTNNGGKYPGVLINGSSRIDITVYKKIKIFAYGHYYGDSVGSAGKNIEFNKYNRNTI